MIPSFPPFPALNLYPPSQNQLSVKNHPCAIHASLLPIHFQTQRSCVLSSRPHRDGPSRSPTTYMFPKTVNIWVLLLLQPTPFSEHSFPSAPGTHISWVSPPLPWLLPLGEPNRTLGSTAALFLGNLNHTHLEAKDSQMETLTIPTTRVHSSYHLPGSKELF